MSDLSKEDKEVILDFYFRCGTDEHINRGRDLIADHEEAAKLYADLADTLTNLDAVKYEPCPDNLAALTVARLKHAAVETQAQQYLENLLNEQSDNPPVSTKATTNRTFWKSITNTAAMAAMLALVLFLGYPAVSNMRQNSWKQKCTANLMKVGSAMATYTAGNNGFLPSVSIKAGDPWWKIGDQGKQNQSNTRHIWLLVKNDYLNGTEFSCPGREGSKPLDITTKEIAALNDFPSRNNVNYSLMIMCDEAVKRQRSGRLTAFMADSNPIFENITTKGNSLDSSDEFTKIMLTREMKSMMSRNHKGRGQNVLFSGGSALFNNNRIVLNDDIFTVKGKDTYCGTELPTDENDIFLAP
ncbi:MAG TPA: hypothetical protein ENH94_01960 [Phycisphaerales bacterium]|nr:hypothetical protein [Phycisphaerales bacterium]